MLCDEALLALCYVNVGWVNMVFSSLALSPYLSLSDPDDTACRSYHDVMLNAFSPGVKGVVYERNDDDRWRVKRGDLENLTILEKTQSGGSGS